TPKPVRTSKNPKDMLRFDLDNENETVRNYRDRIRQCEALGEYAMAEQIRQILMQEQDHQIDLATALGIKVPDVSRGPKARALSKRRGGCLLAPAKAVPARSAADLNIPRAGPCRCPTGAAAPTRSCMTAKMVAADRPRRRNEQPSTYLQPLEA